METLRGYKLISGFRPNLEKERKLDQILFTQQKMESHSLTATVS